MAMAVAIGGDNFLMKVDKMLSDLFFSWHFFFFFKKNPELHNVIMSLSTRVEMDIRNTTNAVIVPIFATRVFPPVY